MRVARCEWRSPDAAEQRIRPQWQKNSRPGRFQHDILITHIELTVVRVRSATELGSDRRSPA